MIILFLGVLSACSLWEKKEVIDEPTIIENEIEEMISDTSLNKFASYQEFAEFVSSQETTSYYHQDSLLRSNMQSDGFMSVTAEASVKGYSDDYSETNIQVEGVDEADIVKTDGKYIYFLVNKTLMIANAYPVNELEIVYQIDFDSRPSELYLHNGKLIVIGHDYGVNIDNFSRPYSNFSFVKVYDVTNPSETSIIKDLSFEGYYNSSRLIGGNLYLILNNNIRKTNDPSEIVPLLIDNGRVLPNDCSIDSNCFSPDIYYFDLMYDTYNLSSINTIGLNNQVEILSSQSYLLSSNQTIYVSLNNIYITFPYYAGNFQTLVIDKFSDFIEDKLSQEEKSLINEINEISDEILNEYEKQAKLQQVYERIINNNKEIENEFKSFISNNVLDLSDEMEKTIVHRFSLANTIPKHEAEGYIPGKVLNQFSMDEDSLANLRLSTTKNNNFLRYINYEIALEPDLLLSHSNVFVLSPDLEVIGSVRNIAPDERIYSTRFMGNRAYMVTFKEIDPFFVIDLEDPRNPQVLGELKIPGFSTYLHPYDENTIIGLGYDTSLSEWGGVITEGVKLALFDVSDPERPIELDTYIAGESGSQSFAMYNHKAFLFDYNKNLLLLPVFLRNYQLEGEISDFAGAFVLSIDDKKFTLRGKINHSEESVSNNENSWCGHRCYNNSVQRGLYIDNTIYTFSNNYLKANDLNSLELVNQIDLFRYIDEEDNIMPTPRPMPMPMIEIFD